MFPEDYVPVEENGEVKELGKGTFGAVIAAKNSKTGENVAIKCIKNTIPTMEIKAMLQIPPHNNIVKLLDHSCS